MKKKFAKFLGVGLALTLVLSLSLVPAAVMGQGSSNYAEYTLQEYGDGGADWSDVEASSGKYSVLLDAGTAGGANAGRIWIDLVDPIPISAFTGVSYFVWEPTGTEHGGAYPAGGGSDPYGDPNINIYLDFDEDGVYDDCLEGLAAAPVGELAWPDYAEQWTEMEEPYGFYDMDDSMGQGTWIAWPIVVGTLDEWKTWLAANEPLCTVVMVKITFGFWADDVTPDVYVDDVEISGVTYDLQPPLSMDASFYQTDETVTVTVIDASANTSATTRETVLVDANSTIPVYSIVLGLLETGVNTGVFTETFTLVGTTPGTGELLVSHGSLITVTYGSDTDTAGVDNVAPVITIVSPTASENTTNATPTIAASYTDVGLSDIDTTSVVMTVDGVDKTLLATVTTSSVTYTPTANLTEGSHAVTVNVSDKAGNAATQASWSFTVDTVDPVITGQVADPDVVEPDVSANITFTATVADATSGVATVTIDVSSIDTATALPMLNDGDGIYSANITTTITTEATYKLLVTATDYAGNSDSANITLGVWLDIVDPVITDPAITYPFDMSSAMPGDEVTISANVTDDVGMGTVTAACTALVGTPISLTNSVGDIWTGTATVASVVAGDYTITITAEDAKGNEATPVSLTLTVAMVTGYDITLSEGWNLISLPLVPTDGSIDVVLADISDNVSQVRTWVYVAGVLTEKVWISDGPADLTQMADGRGYWIEMTEVNELTVTGSVLPAPPQTPPSYSVYEGWNLIGFKSLVLFDADLYLGTAVMLTFERMYGYDAAAGIYTVIQPDINDLDPGQGYWLAVSADGTIYP